MVHIWCRWTPLVVYKVFGIIFTAVFMKNDSVRSNLTINIGVVFPYMVSLYNMVATGCNQSFYKSQQGGNLQLQSSCNQLRSSPVASLSGKLQLDFKTLIGM